jgi:response regulator of citrate/malate metabolism
MVQAHNYHKYVSFVDEFPAEKCNTSLYFLSLTTCGRATKAPKLPKEDKDKFDLIMNDAYMPAMNGFKLLELVGLEMGLPIISKFVS